MSYDRGPEYTAPDDQRCGALVRGMPSWAFEWQRKDHRCPKTANQSRPAIDGVVIPVCHTHARAKHVIRHDAPSDQLLKPKHSILTKQALLETYQQWQREEIEAIDLIEAVGKYLGAK